MQRPDDGSLDDMLAGLDAAMAEMDFDEALRQCELVLKKFEME